MFYDSSVNTQFRLLTMPSSSVAPIRCCVKEKRPWGLSLAAIKIVACLAIGLISSPGVADVSVSWYSDRSSGSSSSKAWNHYKCEPNVGTFIENTFDLVVFIYQHLEDNVGSRLSVSHCQCAIQ